MKKINRRKFLNDVCPTIAISMLGASFLESCSKGGDDENLDISEDTDSGSESSGYLSLIHN